MPMEEFCGKYCAENPHVLSLLQDNHYSNTLAFRRMDVGDLEKMGFKGGDVAALQDAVEEWAVLRDDP